MKATAPPCKGRAAINIQSSRRMSVRIFLDDTTVLQTSTMSANSTPSNEGKVIRLSICHDQSTSTLLTNRNSIASVELPNPHPFRRGNSTFSVQCPPSSVLARQNMRDQIERPGPFFQFRERRFVTSELYVLAFLQSPAIILFFAAVAQLDRVLGYEPRGRGFNSCQPHHNS